MKNANVTILGGGYAGVLSALRIAARAPEGTRVHLVSDTRHFTERIRLHERAAGAAPRRHALDRLLRGTGIEIHVGRVEGIDRKGGTIHLPHETLHYDLALVAMGSRTDWHRVPGAATHADSVCDEDAAETLAARIEAGERTKRIVIGGGLTAVETAAELAERGLPITLVTSGPILPDHSPAARDYGVGVLRALGVELHEFAPVDAIEADAVHLRDGRALVGRAIWCGGFVPAPFAEDAGLASGVRGEILVDETLRSSDRRIFAAGDVARVKGINHLRMGCASAMPMGAQAAASILSELRGETPEPFRFGYVAQCLSLGRRRGLVQFTDRDDRAVARFLRGRSAAFLKEAICRMTVQVLRLERRLPGAYRWPAPRPTHRSRLGANLEVR